MSTKQHKGAGQAAQGHIIDPLGGRVVCKWRYRCKDRDRDRDRDRDKSRYRWRVGVQARSV